MGVGWVYDGYCMSYRINRLTRSLERRKGQTVDSKWRQRLNLKRAVQPQMNTDGHGFAAYCRATPPHPCKGNAEKLKPNPCPPPLPISAFQYFSFCPCGFIVSTAVFRLSGLGPCATATAGKVHAPSASDSSRSESPRPGVTSPVPPC